MTKIGLVVFVTFLMAVTGCTASPDDKEAVKTETEVPAPEFDAAPVSEPIWKNPSTEVLDALGVECGASPGKTGSYRTSIETTSMESMTSLAIAAVGTGMLTEAQLTCLLDTSGSGVSFSEFYSGAFKDTPHFWFDDVGGTWTLQGSGSEILTMATFGYVGALE